MVVAPSHVRPSQACKASLFRANNIICFSVGPRSVWLCLIGRAKGWSALCGSSARAMSMRAWFAFSSRLLACLLTACVLLYVRRRRVFDAHPLLRLPRTEPAKATFCLSFSSVCPEPVLVKLIIFSAAKIKHDAKKGGLFTYRSWIVFAALTHSRWVSATCAIVIDHGELLIPRFNLCCGDKGVSVHRNKPQTPHIVSERSAGRQRRQHQETKEHTPCAALPCYETYLGAQASALVVESVLRDVRSCVLAERDKHIPADTRWRLCSLSHAPPDLPRRHVPVCTAVETL
eukprot:COSAG06_NODE_472_length_15317_cov_10.547312_10_plen_288_part_00